MLRYLALGDSYTIGEGVAKADSFPQQTIKLVREDDPAMLVGDPTIVAVTGWTTDELMEGIKQAELEPGGYDLVTLLIGVNNQYRGRGVENYKVELRQLLELAIGFARGKANHVIVLSIPDWSGTPFAEGRDRAAIAYEIADFNIAKGMMAFEYGCHWLDITDSTRQHANMPAFLVEDKLHPSAAEYRIWAERLQPLASVVLNS
jgi:lysophospholipase L1-like esterase